MANSEVIWVESTHHSKHGKKYLIPPVDPNLTKTLEPAREASNCDKPCTNQIELLPPTQINPQEGIGWGLVNVDGYRVLNCYLIADAVDSSNDRGFGLELSFALGFDPQGIPIGETSYFFDLASYYDPTNLEHGLVAMQSSDLLATGALPYIGGQYFSTILRTNVMGPFVRALAFNNSATVTRSVQVIAYALT